ncbi:MAG: FMN-binding protein [Sphaerochaetaceae bacterium]|nr:FMN-binding protein [Sphaerochaetaceae bacterium]
MRQFLKVGVTLALIAAIAATTLAFVNAVTAPRIAAYEMQIIENALSTVAGKFRLGETKPSLTDEKVSAVHLLQDTDGNHIGYILQLEGIGYGGELTIMASYLNNGEVVEARLLANAETPGLGKKAEAPTYMEKFKATGAAVPVPVKKDALQKEDADSISGATITFAGVAKTIAYGSNYVKSLGGK